MLGFKSYPCEGSFDLCELSKCASMILDGLGDPNWDMDYMPNWGTMCRPICRLNGKREKELKRCKK